jgi:hypothetical protein
MERLNALLTNPYGITTFEFTTSNLLQALNDFLTQTPDQTREGGVCTSEDAKTILLRIKTFSYMIFKS